MTNNKIDTFQNLGAKPGDVVECIWAETSYFTKGLRYTVNDYSAIHNNSGDPVEITGSTFRIISRAPLPYGYARLPDGKVVDLTTLTAPFGLLDKVHGEGTQAALRVHGGPYEMFSPAGWKKWPTPDWSTTITYRVTPKPKVETVTIDRWLAHGDGWLGDDSPHRTPVTVTFQRIDGEIDLGSYKLTAREGGAE